MRRVALRVPAVSAEIRVPWEDDRETIARVISTSMNFPLERALRRKDGFALDRMRCAYVDGVLVASAAELPFRQWFGGAALAMSGIWGVVTLPEHRTGGLASACTGALMDEARRRGDPVTALYPAVAEPYRRLGYEIAGTFDTQRVPLDALPVREAPAGVRLDLLDVEKDLDAVRACYARWAASFTGAIDPPPQMWRERILARGDDTFRAVCVRETGVVTGFSSFDRTQAEGTTDAAFGVDCLSFVATTPASLVALLAYFRGYRGIGRWLQWVGPRNDPITLLVRAHAVETRDRFPWMLRLLDVPGALVQRGYPTIDLDVTVAVDDSRYPDNAGPWWIEVRDGVASVSRAPSHQARPIPIGVLSSMFSGYLTPRDAVRLGHMDSDDPAVDGLAAMFAGPDPWCPFFF
jgi:predicted acetyltransferase